MPVNTPLGYVYMLDLLVCLNIFVCALSFSCLMNKEFSGTGGISIEEEEEKTRIDHLTN